LQNPLATLSYVDTQTVMDYANHQSLLELGIPNGPVLRAMFLLTSQGLISPLPDPPSIAIDTQGNRIRSYDLPLSKILLGNPQGANYPFFIFKDEGDNLRGTLNETPLSAFLQTLIDYGFTLDDVSFHYSGWTVNALLPTLLQILFRNDAPTIETLHSSLSFINNILIAVRKRHFRADPYDNSLIPIPPQSMSLIHRIYADGAIKEGSEAARISDGAISIEPFSSEVFLSAQRFAIRHPVFDNHLEDHFKKSLCPESQSNFARLMSLASSSTKLKPVFGIPTLLAKPTAPYYYNFDVTAVPLDLKVPISRIPNYNLEGTQKWQRLANYVSTIPAPANYLRQFLSIGDSSSGLLGNLLKALIPSCLSFPLVYVGIDIIFKLSKLPGAIRSLYSSLGNLISGLSVYVSSASDHSIIINVTFMSNNLTQKHIFVFGKQMSFTSTTRRLVIGTDKVNVRVSDIVGSLYKSTFGFLEGAPPRFHPYVVISDVARNIASTDTYGFVQMTNGGNDILQYKVAERLTLWFPQSVKLIKVNSILSSGGGAVLASAYDNPLPGRSSSREVWVPIVNLLPYGIASSSHAALKEREVAINRNRITAFAIYKYKHLLDFINLSPDRSEQSIFQAYIYGITLDTVRKNSTYMDALSHQLDNNLPYIFGIGPCAAIISAALAIELDSLKDVRNWRHFLPFSPDPIYGLPYTTVENSSILSGPWFDDLRSSLSAMFAKIWTPGAAYTIKEAPYYNPKTPLPVFRRRDNYFIITQPALVTGRQRLHIHEIGRGFRPSFLASSFNDNPSLMTNLVVALGITEIRDTQLIPGVLLFHTRTNSSIPEISFYNYVPTPPLLMTQTYFDDIDPGQ
jgi:hypothetical protein